MVEWWIGKNLSEIGNWLWYCPDICLKRLRKTLTVLLRIASALRLKPGTLQVQDQTIAASPTCSVCNPVKLVRYSRTMVCIVSSVASGEYTYIICKFMDMLVILCRVGLLLPCVNSVNVRTVFITVKSIQVLIARNVVLEK